VNQSECAIQISKWEAYVFGDKAGPNEEGEENLGRAEESAYRFVSRVPPFEESEKEKVGYEVGEGDDSGGAISYEGGIASAVSRHRRRISRGDVSLSDISATEEPMLDDLNLWDADSITQLSAGEDLNTGNFLDIPDGRPPLLEDTMIQQQQHQIPQHRYSSKSRGHRHTGSFDTSMLVDLQQDMEPSIIKDRLHGYIRP